MATTTATEFFLVKTHLQQLLNALSARGYCVIGPTIDQSAIVYSEINSVDQLPQGWTDQQGPATYRLVRREDDAWFGYAVGPHSWKRYLFPPLATVAIADRTEGGWQMSTPSEPVPKYAFLGVRACELASKFRTGYFLKGPTSTRFTVHAVSRPL